MYVLHGHEVVTVHFPKIKDLHNVYVLKLNRNASLINDHFYELLIRSHVIEHTLYHQNLLKSGHTEGSGAINLGHATRGYLLEQLVLAEMLRTGCAQQDLSETDCNQR